MPKAEAGTPKAIANKAKAKGLQKLKWYCQMCEKQCRDENGFKCHTMSEGHLRQMRIYAEDPSQIMEDYSREFEEAFMEALSRGHGTKRVRANQIYQEVIANKTHIHMNSTKWDTLTTFVKYLGKASKCIVDETEKYIDREYMKMQEEKEKERKADVDEEERRKRMMEQQAKIAKAKLEEAGKLVENEATELKRDEGDGSKVVIALPEKLSAAPAPVVKRPPPSIFSTDDDKKGGGAKKAKKAKTGSVGPGGGQKE